MAKSTPLRSCSVVGLKPKMIYVGQVMQTYVRGDEYASFLGIPYAAHPKGLMRYQAPKTFTPAETPDESIPIYTADVTGKVCSQFYPPNYEGSSDCLYLNIFLPKDPAEIGNPLPVLVFIHGGGFRGGSNAEENFTPDFIVQHGLVFVTINYRLGVFGFLNMRSKECPGNAGLKDQVKALEWIRDNIASFKGDPNNVTLSGHSAGGTCVNAHLISPASKDLFHKAIVQSGGIYCPWGYRGHQIKLKQALSDDSEFRQLLLAENERTLQEHAYHLVKKDKEIQRPRSLGPYFGPTVEKFREGAFITDNIEEMMKNVNHDKPVMAGIVREEGILLLHGVSPGRMYDRLVTDHGYHRQALMDNLCWSLETAEKHTRTIRNKYFPNNRFERCEKQKARCIANFARDIAFRRFYDNFKFGPERTLHKKLFVYRFDHVSEISAVQRGYNDIDKFCGATHGDEVHYLYCAEDEKLRSRDFIYEGPNQNKEIEEVMNHMCSLWANFCKTGIPKSDFDSNNVEWRCHTEEDPCFLSIDKSLKLIKEPLYKEEWRWLNELVNPEPTVESPAVTPE